MIVGLTGKYCAGKNTAAALFVDEGYFAIDVDQVGHEVLEASSAEVARLFGRDYLTSEGSVDRRSLGNLVFRNQEELARLEALVHPRIREEVLERAAKQASPVLINAALLHRMSLEKICRAVVWLEAPLLVRFRRGLRRDSLGPLGVLRRILAQKELTPQLFSGKTDIYRVKNSADRDTWATSVRKVARKLIEE